MTTLVEDVTQMLITGHYFRQTVEATGVAHHKDTENETVGIGTSPELMIICDIAPACDGLFHTDAAVWKRILINLLGNALKYTTSGYIIVKVRLEEASSTGNPELSAKAEERPAMNQPRPAMSPRTVSAPSLRILPAAVKNRTTNQAAKSFNFILTIEDSGKGMSQDYLTHHLFKPFYQENNLSPGTGLGLSIVHQMVSSIGGSIEVTSELGTGTEVAITAGLERQDDATAPLSSSSSLSHFNSLQLGLRGLDVVPDLMETPSGILDPVARRRLALRSILTQYALNLGMSVVVVDSLESTAADIILTTETEYRKFTSARTSAFLRPIVVLATEPTLRFGENSSDLGPAFVLPQPYVHHHLLLCT